MPSSPGSSVLGLDLVVAILLGVFVARRYRQNAQSVADVVSKWCRSQGVPDAYFDLDAAVRSILAGAWPGLSHDGQWWVAMGVEVVGAPSLQRLMYETKEPTLDEIYAGIAGMSEHFGGSAIQFPH